MAKKKAGDEKIKLGLDLTQMSQAMGEYSRIVKNMGIGLDNLAFSNTKLTQKGELSRTTLRGMTKDGRELELQLTRIGNAVPALNKAGRLYDQLTGQLLGPKDVRIQSIKDVSKGSNGFSEKQHVLQELALQKAYAKQEAQYRKHMARLEQQERNYIEKQKINAQKQIEIEERKYARMRTLADAMNTKFDKDMQRRNDRMRDQANAMNAAFDKREANRKDAPTYFDKLTNQASAIVTGILISQAFMRVTSAINSSIDAAGRFQIKMSEIRTISQENQLSLQKWSDEVQKLSDRFGADAFDVAKGTYDAISNQIEKGAKVTEFMNTAMQFAATTVSSTEDAVNLLSTAINSYGDKAHDAEKHAATFFKMIDLGRVTAKDVANNMGTITAMSARMGVSLEDTAAMIATMTNQGVTASNAMTYMRNVLTSLMKPSVPFKEVLAGWGVASGEAAIQTFGLVGVLEKLNEIVDRGGLEELADSLKNIRSIQFGALLSGTGLESLKKGMKEFKNSTDTYNQAKKMPFESGGKQMEIEFNKLKNFFIFQVATPMVNGFAAMNKAAGGLTNAIKQTAQVAAVSIATWVTWHLTLRVSTLTMFNFGKAIQFVTVNMQLMLRAMLQNPWTALATGIAAAIAYLYVYGKSQEQVLKETVERAEDTARKMNEIDTERLQKQYQRQEEAMTEQYQTVFGVVAKIRERYHWLSEQLKKSFEEVNTTLGDAGETFLSRFNSGLEATKQMVNELKTSIKGLKNEYREFEKKRSVDAFEDSISDLSFRGRAGEELARSEQIKLEADALNKQARLKMQDGELSEAQEMFSNARNLYKEALILADEAQKNIKKAEKAEGETSKKYGNYLGKATYSEEYYQIESDVKKMSEEFNKQLRKGSYDKNLLNEWVNATKIMNERRETEEALITREKLKQVDAAKQQQNIVDNMQNSLIKQIELEEKLLSVKQEQEKKLRVAKESVFANFKEALSMEIKTKDTPEEIFVKMFRLKRMQEDVAKQIQDNPQIATFGEGLDIIAKLQAKRDVLEGIIEAKEKEELLDKKRIELEKIQQDQQTKLKDLKDRNIEDQKGFNKNFTEILEKMKNQPSGNIKDKFDIFNIMKDYKNPENLKAEDRVILMERLMPFLQGLVENRSTEDLGLGENINAMNQMIANLKQNEKDLKDNMSGSDTIKSEMETLKQEYEANFGSMTDTVVKNMATQKAAIQDLFNTFRSEIQNLSGFEFKVSPIVQGKEPIKRAFGGGVGGHDTIPAMLSQDEFVMNAQSSRQFYSQLVRMNGRRYNEGGSVTNNSFGNINVNVSGANGQMNASDLAVAVRREFERGTVRPIRQKS